MLCKSEVEENIWTQWVSWELFQLPQLCYGELHSKDTQSSHQTRETTHEPRLTGSLLIIAAWRWWLASQPLSIHYTYHIAPTNNLYINGAGNNPMYHGMWWVLFGLLNSPHSRSFADFDAFSELSHPASLHKWGMYLSIQWLSTKR